MSQIPDSHRDIIEKSPVVLLATIGPKGEPQVTALWFSFEDDVLSFSLNDGRQKTKNLMKNPHASAFFIDPENPFRTIEVRGTATVEPDPDYVLADKVGAKYGANLRDMDVPVNTRMAVTLKTEKVNAFG